MAVAGAALILVLVTLLGAARPVVAVESGGILFVSSFSPTVRWTEAMLAAVNEELAARDRPINLYVEFLDRSRLPATPDSAEWVAFLASKYRDVRPGVIIADGAPAIELMAAFGPGLFGGVPMVGVFPRFEDLGEAGKAAIVPVTTGPHIDRTVDMALDQWPDARRLVIVSDNGGPSHHLARIIRAAVAARTDRRIAVEHLSDYRIEDLENTLAALPRDSVVLYTHLSVDALGRHFRPEEVAGRLARVSAAPFYVLFDSDIGSGAVGGFVNNSRVAGRVAIRAALALADGTWRPPAPGETHYSSGAVVDWRQLRRWGIREQTLPPDTEIRFRQPSLLEEYLLEALAALGFIGVLSAALLLISVLYVQRGRLARALRDANTRLEERVTARTRDIERALMGEQAARLRLRTFLDMATHEFKTPLAVIDSSAQMLERLVDAEQAGVGSRLSLIRRSVRRVVDLVETCLAGERVDEEIPLKPVTFAPAALVGTVVERQRGHGAIILVGDTAALPPTAIADPDLLAIALDALLDNARRYGTAKGGAIEVAAWWNGNALVLSVADRGPGVPEDESLRIFEKYYRGMDNRSTPGTGIGLNLVKTIAELHGGTVAYAPRDGGGSVFTLTVPLDRDREPAAEPDAGMTEQSSAPVQ
ncbi:sensor histidine kinase [Azospirillum doebereinerae]|uniref:sensor histidine kinase n=1 Tax=Azospirillum doebereinerae TaxID=92933 RepID=UPI001EE59391|nr:HAMP domain-containing sensor histidine kinase [Azospirillum doebereinerae]MCG5240667.1 HAMP domain-containing histidine kinase [Azospirillum doebereinerae]